MQGAFRRGIDIFSAWNQPMGVIHTLYYYQVEKSIEDAKIEEARAKMQSEKRKSNYTKRNEYAKNIKNVQNKIANRNLNSLSSLSKEDLEDELDI